MEMATHLTSQVTVVEQEKANWPESWRTPSSSDGEGGVMEMREGCAGKYKLRDHVAAVEVKSRATPRCSMAQDKQEDKQKDSGKHRLGEQAQHNTTGKLNPRWVETLMGLPVGWTMPSCASPVTIVPTNSDCWETELSQQQQNEHSELF